MKIQNVYNFLVCESGVTVHLVLRHLCDLLAPAVPASRRTHPPAAGTTTRQLCTPLCIAAQKGHVEPAKALIEHGAELNVRAGRGSAL